MGDYRVDCDESSLIDDSQLDEACFSENDYGVADLYAYYVSDVSRIPCNDDTTNDKLIVEIKDILDKLNIIFNRLDCDNKFSDERSCSLIADKIALYLDRCKNSDDLNELQLLYSQFVNKRDELVNGNLKLVISIAKEFYRENVMVSLVDIIQFGNLGLMIAVEKYKLGTGASFTTYAYYWIKKEIIKNIRRVAYPTKIPYYLVDKYHLVMSVKNMLCQQMGREPTKEELSNKAGISINNLNELLIAFSQSVSLDETLDFLSEDGMISRVDSIPDDNIDVFEEVSAKGLKEYLIMYMSMYLTERENYVLCQRFGLDGKPRTFCDLADELGVSHQMIGQIQKKAIKKLKMVPQFKSLINYLR